MGKSNFTHSRKRRLDSERQCHRSSEFYDPTMRCWQIHYVEEDERFTSKAPATARPNFDLEFATAGDFGDL
jgi:hypothetical protein